MITLHPGDCLAFAKTLPDNCIDTILTDPPYGLNFMGKEWDRGVPGEVFWAEFLRVAKPGAHLMAFGGTRTWHRLACAIEDAGWEIRDTVAWVYGSGFPKSLDISKAIDKEAGAEREVVAKVRQKGGGTEHINRGNLQQGFRPGDYQKGENVLDITAPATDVAKEWDGWGTNLKPAIEFIILAMKPLDGTYAQNAQKWGVAGLNIDGSRIGTEEVMINTFDDGMKPFGEGAGHPYTGKVVRGRWPANLIHDGSEEVLGLFPPGRSAGLYHKGSHNGMNKDVGSANIPLDGLLSPQYADSGSAARFFFCAKASRSEREEGLENFLPQRKASADFRPNHAEKAEQGATGNPYGRWGKIKNNHATVKPLALMEYLCRLSMTPRGGVVFDPFMGSGTTGMACVKLGRDFIGCENDEGYFKIAEARIRHVQPPLLVEE